MRSWRVSAWPGGLNEAVEEASLSLCTVAASPPGLYCANSLRVLNEILSPLLY